MRGPSNLSMILGNNRLRAHRISATTSFQYSCVVFFFTRKTTEGRNAHCSRRAQMWLSQYYNHSPQTSPTPTHTTYPCTGECRYDEGDGCVYSLVWDGKTGEDAASSAMASLLNQSAVSTVTMVTKVT